MNWQIRTGEQSVIGVAAAIDIVLGRLEYIATHGSRCNAQRLLGEAVEYTRLVRGWVREHQPRMERPSDPPGEYVGVRPGAKPGPMSDG